MVHVLKRFPEFLEILHGEWAIPELTWYFSTVLFGPASSPNKSISISFFMNAVASPPSSYVVQWFFRVIILHKVLAARCLKDLFHEIVGILFNGELICLIDSSRHDRTNVSGNKPVPEPEERILYTVNGSGPLFGSERCFLRRDSCFNRFSGSSNR